MLQTSLKNVHTTFESKAKEVHFAIPAGPSAEPSAHLHATQLWKSVH